MNDRQAQREFWLNKIRTQQATIRDAAEDIVLEYRNSYDAPGFEACVKAEMAEIERDLNEDKRSECKSA